MCQREETHPTELEPSRKQSSTIISAPALLTSSLNFVNVIPALHGGARVASAILHPNYTPRDAESEGEVGCEIPLTRLQRFRGKTNGFGSSRVGGAVYRRFDVDDYLLSSRFFDPSSGDKGVSVGNYGGGSRGLMMRRRGGEGARLAYVESNPPGVPG